MSEQSVIVGAGRAGSCAAALGQEASNGRIVLVGEETIPPFAGPRSWDVLIGKVVATDGFIFSHSFYRENQIDLRIGILCKRLQSQLRYVTKAASSSRRSVLLTPRAQHNERVRSFS